MSTDFQSCVVEFSTVDVVAVPVASNETSHQGSPMPQFTSPAVGISLLSVRFCDGFLAVVAIGAWQIVHGLPV
jgi:hypothetical protein